MNKTTTRDELIRYAYNETGLLESDQIQRGIDGDPIIDQDFREIVEVLNILDVQVPEPSSASMERIMSLI